MKRFFLSKTNIILTFALVLVVCAIAFLSNRLINNDKKSIVPDFYESSRNDVVEWCNSFKNGSPCVIKEDYSDLVENGKLISQSIKPGEKIVDNITFIYSKGKLININVPNNDGELRIEDIEKWALNNNIELPINYIEENDEVVAKGYILLIDPLIVTNDTNAITIHVSIGTPISEDGTIEIKSEIFNGLKPRKLELKAQELGLIPNHDKNKDVHSKKIPVGYIVWHGSGTYEKDETINYGLSLGPDLESIIVDAGDFIGKTEDEFIELVKKFENGKLVATHVEDRDDYSSTIKEGSIVWHGSGEYEDGEKISYGLSLGKDTRIIVNSGEYVGLTYEEFEKTVKGFGTKGLVPNHVNSDSSSHEDDYSDSIAKGSILWHGFGEYEDGEKISYVLSKGPAPTVVVGSFANKTEDELLSFINSNKLSVGKRTEEYSSEIASGKIIRNDSGNIKQGKAINYVVSKGTAILVADYAGKDESELVSFLNNNELKSSRSEEYSNSFNAGLIIRNDSGNYGKGDTIRYVVSKGPKPVEKYHIMLAMYYPQNIDSYDEMVSYLKNNSFKDFTNVTYSGEESDKTAGIILKIEVNGRSDYSDGDYPADTPIKIVISTGLRS